MALSVGDQIGRYTIQGVLGHGGMASVYSATHDRINRLVALKVIHASIQPEHHARFVREAQIVGALDHPNIVPIFDFDDSGDVPFLVMKLIDGSTLKSVLAGGPLPPEDILRIAGSIARALDYAHARGILHRDIKPSNILIDSEGTPYLSDFGLSRLLLSPESTISEGMLLGTPYYMAPEQVLGADVDHRADLYSFGVVIYEMLVGKVPFNAGTPYMILQDHVHAELPRPTALNASISSGVEAFLLRALAKNREHRFASAGEMVLALEREFSSASTGPANRADKSPEPLFAGRAAASPSSSLRSAARTVQRRSRRPWLFAGMALTAFCIVAFLVMMVSLSRSRDVRGSEPPVIPTMPVETLNLLPAQANRRANPDDPIAYLQLARAQYAAGLERIANATLREGSDHTEALLSYWLTAADIARATEQYASAVLTYVELLVQSENTAAFESLRWQVGPVLYALTGEARRLQAGQLAELAQIVRDHESPLVVAFLSRALIVNDNLRAAESALARVASGTTILAEVHLILGELRFAQDEVEQARVEWSLAREAGDAPEWVALAAQQYLDTLSEQVEEES